MQRGIGIGVGYFVRACWRAEAGRSHIFGNFVAATIIVHLLCIHSSPGVPIGVLHDASGCISSLTFSMNDYMNAVCTMI